MHPSVVREWGEGKWVVCFVVVVLVVAVVVVADCCEERVVLLPCGHMGSDVWGYEGWRQCLHHRNRFVGHLSSLVVVEFLLCGVLMGQRRVWTTFVEPYQD